MFIGRQPLRSGRRIDQRAMRAEAAAIFARLGVPLDPARIARGLSIADQQVVVIAGDLSIVLGHEVHALSSGDCLRFGSPEDVIFRNPGAARARHELQGLAPGSSLAHTSQ